MRPTRWLIALSLLAASCHVPEDQPPELRLEWTRSLEASSTIGPALLLGAGGVTLVGTVREAGVELSVQPAGDDFLLGVPLYQVTLGLRAVGVALSPTRAVLAQGDAAGAGGSSAVVVDLTGRAPPRIWSVRLPPAGMPLVADGHWLLYTYTDRDGQLWLELVDLEQPLNGYTHRLSGQPSKAVALQGRMLVFGTFQDAARSGSGWILVSPELAGAGQGFEEGFVPELGRIFEAVVDGEEALLASVVPASPGGPSAVRIARLALADGRPRWPPSKSVEIDFPADSVSPRFAWDGQGAGVLGGIEDGVSCRWGGLERRCQATAGPAFLVEESPDAFHLTPVLLPYLELAGTVSEGSWGRGQAMTARPGRLVAFQGPPYALAWYRIEGGGP